MRWENTDGGYWLTPARHPFLAMNIMATPSLDSRDEMWVPRCPQCVEGTLILAPANQYTRLLPAKLDIYCPHCQWRGELEKWIGRIFVRV